MTELGEGIDETKSDLLESRSSDMGKGLKECNNSLASTHNRTFDHQPIILHNALVRETTSRRNNLLSQTRLSRSRGSNTSGTNMVNLLVDNSTMMVTILTNTSHSEVDTRRMPIISSISLTFTSFLRRLLGKASFSSIQ